MVLNAELYLEVWKQSSRLLKEGKVVCIREKRQGSNWLIHYAKGQTGDSVQTWIKEHKIVH